MASNERAREMAQACAGNRIRQASRVVTKAYDDALRPLGIQISQLLVLVAVASVGDDGAPIGRIAEALVMDQTTVSRSIVPLGKRGLVKMARAPHDARSRVVRLTPSGARLVEAAYPRWKATQRSIRRALGAERFRALHRELGDLVAALG